MAISNQTILKKMSNEIQEAMLQHTNNQKLREHVRSVRLLADLLLEQEGEQGTTDASPPVQTPTVDEVRKMMGTKASETSSSEDKSDHGEANGSSIFDF